MVGRGKPPNADGAGRSAVAPGSTFAVPPPPRAETVQGPALPAPGFGAFVRWDTGRRNVATLERRCNLVGAAGAAQSPAPLVPDGGADRVEVDLPRQLLFLYKGGDLRLTTTIPATRTPAPATTTTVATANPVG